MGNDGCAGCLGRALIGIFVLGLVLALVGACTAGVIQAGSTGPDPCVAYRDDLAARDWAIETNAGKDRLLDSGWLTAEEYEAQRVEVPPVPVEPDEGCGP